MRTPYLVDETGVLRGPANTPPSEAALRSLADDRANMLFVIADGKVVHANRKGEEAVGLGPDERSSSGGSEVFRMVAVAPEYLALSQQNLRRRSRGEEVPPADYALLTRDGRRIEGVLTSALIERDGRRQLVGIFTEKPPFAVPAQRVEAAAVEPRPSRRRSVRPEAAGKRAK